LPRRSIPIALAPCHLCLSLAGRLIPAGRREDWRQEWLSELWYRWHALSSQGAWNAQAALHLYLCGFGCFRDAWCENRFDEERWAGLRAQMRAPSFCAALLGLGLIGVALFSGCFPTTRTILANLPYKNGDRVAFVSRTGRLEGIRLGIPNQLAAVWRRESKLLEGMAACSLDRASSVIIGTGTHRVAFLEGTQNLLDVIGAPVSARVRRSLAGGEPVVFLSYAFWQHELHGDPKLVGGRLWHHHRSHLIAGVLPPDFWFLSPSVQVYALGSKSIGERDTLVIRSKPEVTAQQLEDELFQTADRNDTPFTRTAPHVVFLTDAVRTPIWIFGSSLLIAVVLVCIAHSSRFHRRDAARARLGKGNWRWWFFLLIKTLAALLLVFTLGLEAIVGLNRQLATEALGGPELLWFYTVGCSLVLFGVIADQQARCRVCLQCLAYPIRIGCPGCLFLDWSGTELLCPDGHGLLYVPHHVSCWDEAERWVALEM
jgi:hypothetical protein